MLIFRFSTLEILRVLTYVYQFNMSKLEEPVSNYYATIFLTRTSVSCFLVDNSADCFVC